MITDALYMERKGPKGLLFICYNFTLCTIKLWFKLKCLFLYVWISFSRRYSSHKRYLNYSCIWASLSPQAYVYIKSFESEWCPWLSKTPTWRRWRTRMVWAMNEAEASITKQAAVNSMKTIGWWIYSCILLLVIWLKLKARCSAWLQINLFLKERKKKLSTQICYIKRFCVDCIRNGEI